MKKALITGITGQDGPYLAKLLLENNYDVYGLIRRTSQNNIERLNILNIMDKVKLIDGDLLDENSLINAVQTIHPDEVYNLAAQSFVGVSWKIPTITADINALGVSRLLSQIYNNNPSIKFYQASTSELYGKVQSIPQNEKTPFYPRSPYAIAKLYAYWLTVNYRESHNMFTCNGILFNHESPIRGPEFVTRKITMGVARIINTQDKSPIILGNIDAQRDWGYAGDYVKAMYLMMQHDKPDDYVISSGQTHTIREFIEKAFKYINIDIEWQNKTGLAVDEIGINKKTGNILIKIDPQFFRPAEVDLLLGDSTKARKILNWTQEISFDELIEMMVKFDLNYIK